MARLDGNPVLLNALHNNTPFIYAHLVKFERPSKTALPASATSFSKGDAINFAYISDAAYDVVFDDGSKNIAGTANGNQTYIANKLISVGNISDASEVKATSTNLVFDATPVDTQATAFFTVTATEIQDNINETDFSALGFREGDKVQLSQNPQSEMIITGFKNNGSRMTYINSGLVTQAQMTNTERTLTLKSEEITGLIHSSAADKVSFLHRRVTIYKAFFFADAPHTFIGSPVEIFNGVITNASFSEDPKSGAKITWNLSSFIGDFRRVKGRLTSHEAHQALNNVGKGDIDSSYLPPYARDRGFEHAEKSVSFLAPYTDYEKETKFRKKKILFGLLGSYKEPNGYNLVPVTREADIRFDLQAKYLPVIYGVQRVKGIPIFADLDRDATAAGGSSIYTANAICEGPIQSVLNVYVDDKALSCMTPEDAISRNPAASPTGSNAQLSALQTDVRCVGTATQGLVLKGRTPGFNFYAAQNNADTTFLNDPEEPDTTTGTDGQLANPTGGTSTATIRQYDSSGLTLEAGADGITHEKAIRIVSPTEAIMEFHAGLSDQNTSSILASQAIPTASNGGGGFLLQEQLGLLNQPSKYWGEEHRLLDTAYAVNNFIIDADETGIPSVDYVVSGKLLESYNYDGSFLHSSLAAYSSEDNTKFKTGASVSLDATRAHTFTSVKKNSSGEVILMGDGVNSGAGETTFSPAAGDLLFTKTIIDKFFYRDHLGVTHHRFRWDLTAAEETALREIGYFYMQSGSDEWHMVAYNKEDVDTTGTVTVAEIFEADVTQTSSGTDDYTATISNVTAAASTITDFDLNSAQTSGVLFKPNGESGSGSDSLDSFSNAAVVSVDTSANTVTAPNTTSTQNHGSGTKIVIHQIRLSANASTTNDIYNGLYANFQRTVGDEVIVLHRRIKDYNGSTKIAHLDEDITEGLIQVGDIVTFSSQPNTNAKKDTPEEGGFAGDLRPSINFALMTLDYIKSSRYGLDIPMSKINLDDFLLAATECDTQSDVTIQFHSAETLVAGDVYRYISNGIERWRGTVVHNYNPTTEVYGGTGSSTHWLFTNVTGKLTNRFNTYATREVGELIYASDNDSLYIKTGSDAVQTSVSSGASIATTVELNKVSGTGAATARIKSTSFINVGNPVHSYSFYDSDDVPYWKYLGWTEQRQRYVTRHQGNLTLDTAAPVLDNLKGLLQHFNALVYHSSGKLRIKIATGRSSDGQLTDARFDDSNDDVDIRVRYITDEDIIGQISLKDEGLSKAQNTVSASISDPALDFSDRSITFVNSDFKREDRGLEKSANFNVPGITNYFNARMAAEQALKISRFSRSISFTMRPAGMAILPGELIRINYPRLGWGTGSEVIFRVKSVGVAKDCLITITAIEHDDDIYFIDRNTKSAFFVDEVVTQSAKIPGPVTMLLPVSPTPASPNVIKWSAASGISGTGRYEIWRAAGFSGNTAIAVTSHATLMGTVSKDQRTFTDASAETTSPTNFVYWVRAYNESAPQTTSGVRRTVRKYYGPFNADSDYGGVGGQGTATRAVLKALEETISMNFSTNGITVPTDKDGNNPNFSSVNGFITVEIGNTDITNQVTGFTLSNLSNFSSGQFSISGSNYTVTGMGGDTASVDVTAAIPANSTTGLSVGTTITKKFTVNKTRAGADGVAGPAGAAGAAGQDAYTINGTNENHTFVASTTGAVSMTGFSCTFTVFKGNQAYTYDPSSPYDANSFRYGSITATNVSQVINSSTGQITLAAGSAIASGLSTVTGSLLVPIIDNASGTTVATKTITFSKSVKASRDGGIFTFEENTNSNITSTIAAAFAENTGQASTSFTNSAAQAVATAVIASSTDGFLRPNDRVTVTDNSNNVAGTRIYTGTGTTSGGSVSTSDFSALVVETFNGSVIVEGTLSADRLAANTTTTNTLNVGSNIVLNNSGKFYTQNKTAFTDNDAGFFLGYDSTAHKLNIGNASNFLKWDGTNVLISGNISFTNAPNISTFTNDSGFTDDTAANAAQTTANTGVANAAAAQTTANTGVANAAAAQTTANTGVTNAAAAQGTANTANSRAQNFDTSGDIFQGISVGTGGHVRGGQSAFNNGIGFFLGYSGSAYKFSIGNSSGQRLTWDGSTLSVNGNITITSTQINSALGYTPTDDTAANAAQTTANTAVTNAATAQTTANSKITGSQVNANVTNISGGAIQTGTVSAARIDVGSIVIGNLSGASSFKGALTNLNNPSSAITPTDDTVANTKITGSQVNANVTSISGGVITTGTVAAARLDVSGIISAGGIIVSGDNISSLNNDSGFTDDTAANAAQGTANTAVTNAAAAQGTANTAITNAATAQTTANSKITGSQVNANVTAISGGVITTGTINANRINIDGVTLSRSGNSLVINTGGVDTTQIAGNAVTNANSAYNTPFVSNQTTQTVTFTATGAPVFVAASWTQNGSGNAGTYGGTASIKQNGSTIWSQSFTNQKNSRRVQNGANISFTPSAGTCTVTLVATNSDGTYQMGNRSLFVLETKR